MTVLFEEAIAKGIFPGACWATVRPKAASMRAVGNFTYCPESPTVQLDTLWDLASVSKVMGTTTVAMRLYEDGKFALDQPVSEVLPEFGVNGKEKVTFEDLLVHTSGLAAFRPYTKTLTTPAQVLSAVLAEGLQSPIGTKMVYSDLGMITLGLALEKLGGDSLDVLVKRHVVDRLMRGVAATYNPADRARCAPTEPVEPWRRSIRAARGLPADEPLIQGEVHDPNAFLLGGVAGHAGMFGELSAVVSFVQALFDPDRLHLKESTVRLFTTRRSSLSTRALGWDTKSETGSSAGSRFGPRSFGHTGFTGTSVWIDPDRKLAGIILSNRVHPTADNTELSAFRPVFYDAVAAHDGN